MIPGYTTGGGGQDRDYQHILFFEVPWGNAGETGTMWAKAPAPTHEQLSKLNVIKLIGAVGGITMQPGLEKTLLDMVTETNAALDMMVGRKFPRIAKTLLRPVHKSLGVMEIVGGGRLALCESDMGTRWIFYDIKAAETWATSARDSMCGARHTSTS